MKICIDAGHNFSSYDTGAQGNGLREQDITFGIASKLKPMLEGVGVEVIMTRTHLAHNIGLNYDDSLAERCRIANNNKCDLFISIHCNSHANASANGTEVLVYKFGGEAEKLAEKVQAKIIETFNIADRGIKEYNAKVLRSTNMPAILVETAFISNPNEAELLRYKQSEFARAIFEGVCDYLGLKAKQTEEITKISAQPKIESGNDIDYVLKWKYGITFDSVENERAFIKELDEMKAKDSKAYWVFYKLVNGQTVTEKEYKTIEPYTYHIEGITHIIECDPMAVKNVETQCATNKTDLKNFVSGTYIMLQENGKYAPLGMCKNEDKLFANIMTHGKPVATLIIYKDGTVKMKYVSDITKETNVRFAISGYGIYPKVTAENEGFTGKYADVLRSTDRPIIGYRSKDNKIVIAVRSASSAERANQTAKNLKLDFAISLDAGGTTTLIVDEDYKFKGDGRMNYGGISWE